LDVGFLNQKQKDKAARSSLNLSLTYNFKMKKLKLFKPIKPIPAKEGEEETE
jgi:hypothetical protein